MKKILALLLAVSMVFALAACGSSGTKVTVENDDKTISIELSYPENAGIELGGEGAYVDFTDDEEQYYVFVELFEHDMYDYYKSGAVEDETFTETKIGGYYAYSTDDGDSMYTTILFEEEPVEDNVYRYAEIQIDGPLNTDTDIKDFVKGNKEIQSILNSIKYLGETKAE